MSPNLSASVLARLDNRAKQDGRPFQEILEYYGLERFLYRLSQTEHAGKFLLKGALLLRVWGTAESRPTRDIDLLAYESNEVSLMERIIRDACAVEVDDDGLRFDADSVHGERIKEQADYSGVRVKFTGYLDRARIPMQIDISFGDVIHPAFEQLAYPTLLDFPAPALRMYPKETVIAEKFEAIVKLGTFNSRFKDFFDIWTLSRQFDFDGAVLAEAIRRTFRHRGTSFDADPAALQAAFTAAERTTTQWIGFLRRARLENVPRSLDHLRDPLRAFLLPPMAALITGHAFDHEWRAPGPWTNNRKNAGAVE